MTTTKVILFNRANALLKSIGIAKLYSRAYFNWDNWSASYFLFIWQNLVYEDDACIGTISRDLVRTL